MSSSADSLSDALARHGIELPDEQLEPLQQYCTLLWDWNTKLNLTRHTDYEKFVGRDLVDSLAFSEFLAPGESILDVGTGGGVPGILLAILRPDLSVSLCESVGKRARVVAEIVDRLELQVPVYESRVEDLMQGWQCNTLVVRAVARLSRLLTWLKPRWIHFDRLLALKGPAWVGERGEARHLGLLRDMALRKLTSYPLPGTDSESVLLQICPQVRLIDNQTCQLTDRSKKLPTAKKRRKPHRNKYGAKSRGGHRPKP